MMKLHVFQGADHTVGLTPLFQGTNLPTRHGAWQYVKEIDMRQDDQGHLGVDSEQALLDIGTNGYHLSRVGPR
jgi:hypothetical protein